MAWLYVLLAALCEVSWIVILKANNGFTKLWPSVAAIFLILTGPYFVNLAMKSLGMGTCYALWIGLNSILMVVLGAIYFGESVTFSKVACVALIVLGAVGLKLIEAGVIKA